MSIFLPNLINYENGPTLLHTALLIIHVTENPVCSANCVLEDININNIIQY